MASLDKYNSSIPWRYCSPWFKDLFWRYMV